MTTNWQPAMKEAISEVLETMFFVLIGFSHHAPDGPAFDAESRIHLYNDDERIEIIFRVTSAFARMITANFLAKGEEEVAEDEMEDLMRELANMAGGNYKRRIESERWELGIPSYRKIGGGEGSLQSGLPLSYLGEAVGMILLERSVMQADGLS